MIYLQVNFTNPWLLLLIIPLLAIVLYSFFKVNKRFRYSRNKVTSLVLSTIYMISASFLAAGCSINYTKPNDNNEVFILVDDSYSTKDRQKEKNFTVEKILDSTPENVKTGIIRFGFDAVVALPLGKVTENSYQTYIDSEKPLDIASNIEGAINLAYESFTNVENSKIVILSDAIETDGDAKKYVSSVALDGMKVDVLPISTNSVKNDLIAKSVTLPKEHITKDKATSFSLEVISDYNTNATIKMFDNAKEVAKTNVIIKKGQNDIPFTHTFSTTGLHELSFVIESNNEDPENNMNNRIYSYVNLETVDRILILEKDNEGDTLYNLFKDNYKIEVKNISDAPLDIDSLREYDEVILANIANKDMPKGFIEVLNDYALNQGGSVLTIGGNKADGNPNVYNREDMADTLYQEMLPVLAEDYTPPVGVMLVFDCSGSMTAEVKGTGKTRMEVAREAALKSIRALDPRDYLGIVSFSSTASLELMPTPVADTYTIERAIKCLTVEMSGTVFTSGLNEAGTALNALTGVNQKHIILVTDGEPGDTEFIEATENNLSNDITTSSISFVENSSTLQGIAEAGNGRCYCTRDGEELVNALKDDMSSPEIREYELEEFEPRPGSDSTLFNGINMSNVPTLDGFYGTRLKKDAKALMVGDYNQPIYATWQYGAGRVSSFMCDLSGNLSHNFVTQENGRHILTNLLDNLFPMAPIRKEKIEIDLSRKNLNVQANIYSKPIKENEKMTIEVNKVINDGENKLIETIEFDKFDGNLNTEFKVKEPGLYEIVVSKIDENGTIYETEKTYEAVSYSKEYDTSINADNAFIESLVEEGNGDIVDVESVYSNLILERKIHYDLRYVLAGITITLFLADIAVRKFKFKWIHEIIEDKKRNKK